MITIHLRKRDLLAWAVGFALLGAQAALGQDQIVGDPAAGTPVAEAPVQPAEPPQPAPTTPIDKRIFGVLPNYRTADGTLPYQPISAAHKMNIALKDSFDWPNYFIGGAFAGLYQLENSHPAFGQGVEGYGRYYGTSYADQVIGNMLTEGIMPIVLHEDPRYFRKGRGGVWGRLGYSLTRTLVAKTDHGNKTFNFAEVIGNGIGAEISSAYYTQERSMTDVATRWGTQIATDSLSNVLKEFWPDIKRRLFKRRTEEQALTGIR
jgi:hypothetical protein